MLKLLLYNYQFLEGKVKSIKLRKRKTKRECLRCDSEFMSEGKFNRICPNCQEINSNIYFPDIPDSFVRTSGPKQE